jgi:hypothetical protein
MKIHLVQPLVAGILVSFICSGGSKYALYGTGKILSPPCQSKQMPLYEYPYRLHNHVSLVFHHTGFWSLDVPFAEVDSQTVAIQIEYIPALKDTAKWPSKFQQLNFLNMAASCITYQGVPFVPEPQRPIKTDS